MSDEVVCPGRGQCHGAMKWCPVCGGAAAHVCPHSESDGCMTHPSRAALLADLQEAEALVWVADSDLAVVQSKVNALRKQLAPLEAELQRQEAARRRAVDERDEAKERLAAYERHNRST